MSKSIVKPKRRPDGETWGSIAADAIPDKGMVQTGIQANELSDASVKTKYENNADTNAYTDAEKAKVAAMDVTHYSAPLQDTTALAALAEASITDKERRYVEDELSDYFYDSTAVSGDVAPTDQTGGTGFWRKVAVDGETAASIKTKYESNVDTNAFTDALLSKLNGIAAGAQVNNISNTNATDLTDGGESTLHYHASDRARGNHTGTQTAATISDFDTEVANNTAVVANTAKVSASGSVTSHSDVTSAGSGIIISSAERTKLNGIETGATNGANVALANYYVNPTTGSDITGDGSSGNPWQTIFKALISIQPLSINPATECTINLAAGTHTPTSQLTWNHPDGNFLNIVGDSISTTFIEPTHLTNQTSSAFSILIGCKMGRLSGFTIRKSTYDGNGVGVTIAAGASLRLIDRVRFDKLGIGVSNYGNAYISSFTTFDAYTTGVYSPAQYGAETRISSATFNGTGGAATSYAVRLLGANRGYVDNITISNSTYGLRAEQGAKIYEPTNTSFTAVTNEYSPERTRSGTVGYETGGSQIIYTGETPPSPIFIANSAYYLATTGSDTTGDGTSGNPWYSINKAISHLQNYRIDPSVGCTIHLAAGTYSYTEQQDLSHPNGQYLSIQGAGLATTTIRSTTSTIMYLNSGCELESLQLFKIDQASPGGTVTALSLVEGSHIRYCNIDITNIYIGIRVNRYAKIYLSSCTITDFSTGIDAQSKMCNVEVYSCTITGNAASYSTPKGIYIRYGSKLHMFNTSLTNCEVGGQASDGGTILVSAPTLSGNTTDWSPTLSTANVVTYGNNFGKILSTT